MMRRVGMRRLGRLRLRVLRMGLRTGLDGPEFTPRNIWYILLHTDWTIHAHTLSQSPITPI